MLADELDYVVGVDTHAISTCSQLSPRDGALIAQRSVAANAQGYAEAIRFCKAACAGRACVGRSKAQVIYGAGLARCLSARGEVVHESGRSSRAERRLRGKDDPLDATRAARSALASNQPHRRGRATTGGSPRAPPHPPQRRRCAPGRTRALRSMIVTAPDETSCGGCRWASSFDDAAASRLELAHTRPTGNDPRHSARSRSESRQQPTKPTSSNARSSLTSERSRPTSWPSRASARSSPHN